jgi:3-dehydroquinate synthase
MRKIKLLPNNAELTFTNGMIAERDRELMTLCSGLAKTYTRCAIITDQTVYSLYGKLLSSFLQESGIPFCEIILPSGESSKTLLSANYCWNEMIANRIDRHSCVIALGGGVITDLAGFAAACYMRGIDVINIPTTLLGMVDAAIGGKTGFNVPQGKNLIGAFHHPKAVFICPSFVQTLPDRQYRAGIAEVIKYGVISDQIFFQFLENNIHPILLKSAQHLNCIIQRCCEIKNRIVEEDPTDSRNIRIKLNWGHTFAHGIESATHYQKYLHGEAVAIGMSCAAAVSNHMGYANKDFVSRQDRLIREAQLPISLPNIPLEEIVKAMENDKKTRMGKFSLIVAAEIGTVFRVLDVDRKNILEILSKK